MTGKALWIAASILALGMAWRADAQPASGGATGAAREPLEVYTAARTGADSWLALVDRGKYGESWDAAAKLFRAAVTRADWSKAVRAARGPLGKVLSRKMKSADRKASLPGVPDGDYVVIQFDTSFAKKMSAVETVTPMREADGTWKVSGYFVR